VIAPEFFEQRRAIVGGDIIENLGDLLVAQGLNELPPGPAR